MKNFNCTVPGRTLAHMLVALFLLSPLLACNRQQAPATPASAANQGQPPETPAAGGKPLLTEVVYVCPMHPHIHQAGPGVCPICGMTLEKKLVSPIPVEPALDIDTDEGNKGSAGTDRRVLYYYDPMRPEVHFDKPGPSPFMDMALVPKFADARRPSEVAVSAAVIQSLGIRTAQPTRRNVRPSVRVPARVVADARGQARLQSRVSGWVERLNVRAVGQSVSAGTVIAEIYSPELVQAQEEMLLGADTAGPAAERLRRFGIADSDIQAIRRAGKSSRRLPLRAPVSGVVTELGVREGSSLSPDTVIADFSARNAVWIEAQLFPMQLAGLGEHLSARFTLPGLAGREWRSDSGTRVPVVDAITQTLAVRFPIDASSDLSLGSVLDAQIDGESRADVLLVPASAVIRTAQGDRVLVQRGKDSFSPTEVILGQHFGDDVEIISGVSTDDRIVTSGQFLLDAEASLQSGLGQMEAMPAPASNKPAS